METKMLSEKNDDFRLESHVNSDPKIRTSSLRETVYIAADLFALRLENSRIDKPSNREKYLWITPHSLHSPPLCSRS
jgi:hypothetical protein